MRLAEVRKEGNRKNDDESRMRTVCIIVSCSSGGSDGPVVG